jgi:hypothetical protein
MRRYYTTLHHNTAISNSDSHFTHHRHQYRQNIVRVLFLEEVGHGSRALRNPSQFHERW